MLVQHRHRFQEAGLLLSGKALIQKITDQHADGVHRILRQGGVAAHAYGGQMPDALTRRFGRDPLRILRRLIAPDPGLRLVRHGVGGKAALDIHDVLHGHLGQHAPVVDALLPVAQGEVGVRAEAEQGGLVVLQIILHVLHAGLLVDAQQGPDGVAQGHAPVLQVFQGVQAQHAGSLVVHNAPADDIALPLPHGKGVAAPAVAGGHHVQVGDGSQIILPLPDLGIADFVLAVDGLKPQLLRHGQRLLQRLRGAFAIGGAGLGLPLHAVDGHQPGDILKQGLLVFLNECVDITAQFCVHIATPFPWFKTFHIRIFPVFLSEHGRRSPV